MGWLIGLVCVVIVLYFWRFFLPLGIILALAGGIFYLYYENKEEKGKIEKAKKETALSTKISEARAGATPLGKEWKVYYQKDPASGKSIARGALIDSNDGLCHLDVQVRLNGARLTGLDCPDFGISSYKDIEVKFDNLSTSDQMRLDKYSDSERVYIPPYQHDYSNHLSYDNFLSRLTTGKAVAIKIPSAGGVWMTFSLNGSTEALDMLGKEQVATEQIQQ